jgi:beta-glucosidase
MLRDGVSVPANYQFRKLRYCRHTKKALYSGETKTVSLKIKAAELAFYDRAKNQWVLEPGAFKLLLGSSSRDIRAERIVTID